MRTTEQKIFLIALVVICVGIASVIFFRFFGLYEVVGNSMEPTLHDRQLVVVNKDKSIQRGDLILFKYDRYNFMKRVIGLPGDQIEAKNNRIYINGKELDEPYMIHQKIEKFGPVKIPDQSYFVLGDDRETSIDSREIGFVHDKDIIGKLVIY